jgi:small-conductance mechanosensitive channel
MEEYKTLITSFISHDNIKQLIVIGVKIVLIYVMLMAIVFLERRLFKKFIERREKQSTDKTNLIFLRNVVLYTTYCIGFLSMINQIPGMQQLSATLLTGAGILAAAVGFGSQQAISNIVSGIFMVIFKPFRVGDHITLGGESKGTVVDISLRHTTIKNSENKMIVIPNTVLNNQSIINSYIVRASCAFVAVGIGYGADINTAMMIMREEAMNHPLLIDNRTEIDKTNGVPQVIVRVIEWTNSSINLRAWAWASNSDNAFVLKCDLLKSIKERFDRDGVEMPYSVTSIRIKQ